MHVRWTCWVFNILNSGALSSGCYTRHSHRSTGYLGLAKYLLVDASSRYRIRIWRAGRKCLGNGEVLPPLSIEGLVLFVEGATSKLSEAQTRRGANLSIFLLPFHWFLYCYWGSWVCWVGGAGAWRLAAWIRRCRKRHAWCKFLQSQL